MLVVTILESKPAKVETEPLILVVPLIRSLANNAAMVAAPLEIVTLPLPMTNALEFNPTIVVIVPLIIKPSGLITTMHEVKAAKVETASLIVVHDAQLIRSLANNATMVVAPPKTVSPPLSVTIALEFNPAIVVIASLVI